MPAWFQGVDMKRGIFAVGLSLAACIATVAARAETLDNDSVVALVSAGLGDEAVIAKIKASPARYRLSTEDLIRSEEHMSELQSLMRISYAVFCLTNKNKTHR